MNWFKFAKDINDFDDRNRANEAIHWLDETAESLEYCVELVFMSPIDAKKILDEIINHKKMSNYPSIKLILLEAQKCVRDNPKKFGSFCLEASVRINDIKQEIEEERHTFTNNNESTVFKGIQDE